MTFRLVSCRALLVLLVMLHPALAHALPRGAELIPTAVTALQPYGPADAGSIVTTVDVTGQPFTKALRIDTYGKSPGRREFGLKADVNTPLKQGDVLWISFKARKIDSKRETGDASFELRFDQLVDGKYKWPAHMDRGISFGSEWTETSIPFVMGKDTTPADVRLVIRLDSYEQRFELGPVTFLRYGPEVRLADLPRSVVRYEGGEPDALWRKAAAERIETLRKGDLTVQVVDANGQPVPGASVAVQMTRNAFHWGTAIDSRFILDDSADGRKYRDTLKTYFNHVVYENEVKYKNWIGVPEAQRGLRTKRAGAWLRDNGLTARGHVLVWPSWNQTPPLAPLKDKPEQLRATVLQGIAEQTTKLRGEFTEWDVVNEATLNHDFMDLLGPQEMLAWFKAARAGAPGVKLYYNDFTMFHGRGPKSGSQKFFEIAKYLKDNGAEMDAIGEQAHIGGTPPAIDAVLERLDHFSQLQLPILITEFDINSNDDDFKARYLTDFVTALYSHPSAVGFVQWGFWEGQHWFPVAALWNKDWTIRKHGQAYVDLVTKTWWTDTQAVSAADGTAKVRGFTGDYKVTVKHGGKSVERRVTLDNKGQRLTVAL